MGNVAGSSRLRRRDPVGQPSSGSHLWKMFLPCHDRSPLSSPTWQRGWRVQTANGGVKADAPHRNVGLVYGSKPMRSESLSSWRPTVPSSTPTISCAWLDSLASDQPFSSEQSSLAQPSPSAWPSAHVELQPFWPVPMHSWFDVSVRLLLPDSPWVDGPGVQVENLVQQELQLPVRYGSLLV